MASLFSGNPTGAQARGRVKDFLNWNMPLLTGVEADYGGSPAGTPGHGESNYWIDALTGNTAGNIADQASASAHSGGWQGWLADSLKNAGTASGWNPSGWMNTETMQRTNYDPSTPFLKLSDLRATSGYTDPSGSNYTVAGDFQNRKYDPTAALDAAQAANFMPGATNTAIANSGFNNYANEASEAATAAAAAAANSGAVINQADGSVQRNNVTTTGANNNASNTVTNTGPSVDDLKGYITNSFQTHLNRDPVFTGNIADGKADYWIQEIQNKLSDGTLQQDGIQAFIDNHILGSSEYAALNSGGNNNNTATGAPSVDDIKNYLGSAYKLYLNRDPVYNNDFADTADYWIKETQDRFANNEFGGANDTWQDWLSKSIRGGSEYTDKFNTGTGTGTGGNNTIDTSQFLTQQGLSDWWNTLDKSAFTGNQSSTSTGGMNDMMQFMMFMNMMRPQGGGLGGSQYGYGGMNPGGVQSAYNPMDNLQNYMNAFNTFKGGTTVNTGTTTGTT